VQGGELAALKGAGFSWVKPAAGPAPLDFIGYGQSNWLFHTTNQTGRPAANAGTLFWDRTTSTWIEPVGNGIRTFLNSMQAITGRVCRLVSGGQSGVPIASLQKGAGTGFYETLLADVAAAGIDASHIILHHGEGDAEGLGPTIVGYRNALNTLHMNIASDTSKTLAQLPLIISSLATVGTEMSMPTAQQNANWQIIQDAIAGVNSAFPNIHYSHSNLDATLVDGIHWDGPAYGRSGARYARTVQFLMGLVSTRPLVFATAAERVSATETRIRIAHGMGTDYTPTSGITGFEVTNDNGATWIVPTGAREDGDDIILTHSALGTVERKARYQYGRRANVTAPLRDNSGFANLLNFTSTDLVAAGAAALPSITWAGSATSASSNTSQGTTGIAVPGSSQALLAVIGLTGSMSSQPTAVNVTAQPSGTVIAATSLLASQAGNGPGCYIYQALLPPGTTSVDIAATYASNPFNSARFHVSTIPVAGLASTTAVSAVSARSAAATGQSVNLATSEGGVIFAIAASQSTVSNPGTLSGTETYATRNNLGASAVTHIVGDASNVAANAASTVTATYVNSAGIRISAACWR
jgi:Carbohydrate esterase, sialic acid-specific acetylesterase